MSSPTEARGSVNCLILSQEAPGDLLLPIELNGSRSTHDLSRNRSVAVATATEHPGTFEHDSDEGFFEPLLRRVL